MNTQKPIPQPLLRKIILTPLLGAVCLAFGLAAYIGAGDRTLLILSGVLFATCIFKGIQHYRTARSGRYLTVCGTCVRIAPQFMGKLRKVCLMDDDGIEITLRLPTQHRVTIGNRYRFYFAQSSGVSVGNDYLDRLLATDSFLGYELAENVPENSSEDT